MIFWTVLEISLKSLASNKLRSILAMLGIIIGVWSVISALALAAGAQQSVSDRITSMGTNLLTISPSQRNSGGVFAGRYQNLKVDDAASLLSIPEVYGTAPVVRGSVQAKYFNRNTSTTVLGTSPSYFAVRNFVVEHGRALTDGDCDASSRVAVIGTTTAKSLFGDDYIWSLGQPIQIKGVSYRVIGLLQSKGDQGWFNPDNQIIVPFTTAMKQVLGVTYLDEIAVSAKDESQLTTLQSKATLLLRKRHYLTEDKDNDFDIRNQADLLSTASNINLVLSLLLGGIAGISLLVGGIGVMNIMLVTVAERTREIGIRKAIGAKQRDILRQFLIESIVMSTLGGLIGGITGIITAQFGSMVQDNISFIVKPTSVLLALSFSLAVGVFFGYYPARRAAKLDPIEALRYE